MSQAVGELSMTSSQRGFPARNVAGIGATGFTPLHLPGCRVWLDASDASTITESSNAVSQWADKSGNGLHFSQATGANQPTTGSATQNGLNVLSFDGSNDTLGTSSWGTSDIGTAFAVVRPNITINYKTIVGAKKSNSYSPSQADAFYLQFAEPTRTPATAVGIESAGQSLRATGSQVANQTWHLIDGTVNRSSLTVTLTVNGGTEVTSSTATAFSSVAGNVAVGGGYFNGNLTDFLNCLLAEVVLYDVVLTSRQRQLVRRYLNAKWAVY